MKKTINISLIIIIIFSNFIPFFNVSADEVKIGYVTDNFVRFRNKPTTSGSNIIKEFSAGTRLIIFDESPSGNGCKSKWFYVEDDGVKGYVCSEYIKIHVVSEENINMTFAEQLESFPESYRSYLIELNKYNPSWIFQPLNTNIDFNEAVKSQSIVGKSFIQGPEGYRSTLGGSYDYQTDKFKIMEASNWYAANEEAVAYYLDPRNFLTESSIFMFEDLTFYPSFQTLEVVERVLSSEYLKQFSQFFINAANIYNVSPVHLASRVRQEVGLNGSPATTGGSFTYFEDNKKYSDLYNFFNIGATTSKNPVQKGLVYANGGKHGTTLVTTYNRPWTSPEKSILGGASFISSGYVNKGQFTSYLQKFNVNPESAYSLHTHQYMTNIMAPFSEASTTYQSYIEMELLNEPLIFTIPIFKDMPSKTELPNSGNPNNYLSYLKINDKKLESFSNELENYTLYVSPLTKSIKISSKAINSKTKINGLGEIQIKENDFIHKITVVAENEAKREFNLNIIVTDENPISVDDIVANIGVKYNNGYISGINLNTDVSAIKKNVEKINAFAKVKVTDSNGKDKENKTFSTGDKIVITSGEETKTYTIVIYGDTNNDGEITITDLLRVQKHILGIRLSGAYYEAADVNKDSTVDIVDLLIVQKHLLKEKEIKQ